MRLAVGAEQVMNKVQAGFIMDQVKLAKMMMAYTNVTEQDAMMVVLDQEKVHDRISHLYMENNEKIQHARKLH